MTIRILTFISFCITLVACSQKHGKHKHSAEAVKLNDSAVAISVTMTDSDYQQAVLLLDKATAIDSNYYRAYLNKMGFEMKLKRYDSALVTANNLIRIRPAVPDIYVTCGIIYEKDNDTVSSKKYFQQAQVLYKSILDTMNTKNSTRDVLVMKKAICLVMLGDETEGKKELQQLYATEADAGMKQEIAPFINKNKQELLQIFSEGNAQAPATVQPGKK